MDSKNNNIIICPEHEKLKAVQVDADIIRQFLIWMIHAQGFVFAKQQNSKLYESYLGIEGLLHGYYGIDDKKLDLERQQMLEALKASNNHS